MFESRPVRSNLETLFESGVTESVRIVVIPSLTDRRTSVDWGWILAVMVAPSSVGAPTHNDSTLKGHMLALMFCYIRL